MAVPFACRIGATGCRFVEKVGSIMYTIVFNIVTPNGARFTNVVGPYDDKALAQKHVNRLRYRMKRGYITRGDANDVKIQIVNMITPRDFVRDMLT